MFSRNPFKRSGPTMSRLVTIRGDEGREKVSSGIG